MYNLLVTSSTDAWNGEPYVLGRDRVLTEYTDSMLRSKYGGLDDKALLALQGFPTLFAYEGDRKGPFVGHITELLVRGREVRIKYKLDMNIGQLPADTLSRCEWELDIGNYEEYRTHWALKDKDLLGALVEGGVLAHDCAADWDSVTIEEPELAFQYQVAPRVFRVPQTGVSGKRASVMMPFKPDYDRVFGAISVACSERGLECVRADGIWQESEIMQDIFDLIYTAKIVIVDFTDRNPNVMYETGIAHTLGRHVVPLSQSHDDIPFDLRQHRVLLYENSEAGLRKMQAELARRLAYLIGVDK